jgi:predicted GNAT superfamily acetyltransferase
MDPFSPLVRDATHHDFAQILALNAESVHFLSPLTSERLAELHRESAYHRVVATDKSVSGFLLALREGCTYDSPNYQWFAARYEKFLYIDRIVICGVHQGQGIGQHLYSDLFAFARRTDAGMVTCEFDVDPPNEPSRRFHARFGFQEVGGQWVASGMKRVSMQAVSLAPIA